MVLFATSSGKVYKASGVSEVPTELFPGSTDFPSLKQIPAMVKANNNLLYFTDGERWYVTDGTIVKEAGMPHPVDAPTFVTAAGTLNVATNRYYWVSWADLSGEFFQWSSTSPRSAATGALSSQKVTITRPNHPPPRATHWLVFASETDDDATFGALLALVPVATSTFEDQSPFLDEQGSAMVSIRRPVRNNPLVPGNWAKLHKGRIFVGGFNKVPYVIRNPSFDDSTAATLTGWTTTGSPTATGTNTLDGKGALSLGNNDQVDQAMNRVLKPSRKYRIEFAVRDTTGTGVTLRLNSATGGVQATKTVVNATSVWSRNEFLDWDGGDIPSDLKLEILCDGSSTGVVDFLRTWEIVPPSFVGYTALEEVEGLQNGRGEECMPGSTPTPEPDDSSDLVNALTYPAEASEIIGGESFADSLVVWSDTSGVPILGDSFDDFAFAEQVTLASGLANRFAVTKSRHGLFFVSSDLKVFRAPLLEPAQEVSMPLRLDIAEMDTSDPVWLTAYDYGERAWLVLAYKETGGNRILRLMDLETGSWFRFNEWATDSVAQYEPLAGSRVLLATDGANVRVVQDPKSSYPAATGNAPAATLRQVLLDLGDPASFKVWKNVRMDTDTNGNPDGLFWLDPVDPDNPGTGNALAPQKMEGSDSLWQAFLQKAADAHGKRLLLEFSLPTAATPGKVRGLEVVGERATRWAR
jgi:hypothetical protein